MKAFKSHFAIIVLATFAGMNTATADERDNPFVPPTPAEEQRAIEDERVRNLIIEMQPELKKLIMQEVAASQSTLEVKLRRRIERLAKDMSTQAPRAASVSSGDAATTSAGAGSAATASEIPEGSTFISCVNGKALYRDADNTLFQVLGNGIPGSDRCAG